MPVPSVTATRLSQPSATMRCAATAAQLASLSTSVGRSKRSPSSPAHVDADQARGVRRAAHDAAAVDEPGQADADRRRDGRIALHQGA